MCASASAAHNPRINNYENHKNRWDKIFVDFDYCLSRHRPKILKIHRLLDFCRLFRNGSSESKATELLRADISWAESIVQKSILVPLQQNQYDALVIV